ELYHNPFANASFSDYFDVMTLMSLIIFSEIQSISTGKQVLDNESIQDNDANEQILTLTGILAELQDPGQKKTQLLQMGFIEYNLDLRSGGLKCKYRIVIKNLLDEDFRQNLLESSEQYLRTVHLRYQLTIQGSPRWCAFNFD
ncbi:MAG: hypothetical protein EZS28_050373, partial [Streblomastix strix]